MTTKQIVTLYCGNVHCPSREVERPDGGIGQRWPVDVSTVPDGEPWLCPACEAAES